MLAVPSLQGRRHLPWRNLPLFLFQSFNPSHSLSMNAPFGSSWGDAMKPSFENDPANPLHSPVPVSQSANAKDTCRWHLFFETRISFFRKGSKFERRMTCHDVTKASHQPMTATPCVFGERIFDRVSVRTWAMIDLTVRELALVVVVIAFQVSPISAAWQHCLRMHCRTFSSCCLGWHMVLLLVFGALQLSCNAIDTKGTRIATSERGHRLSWSFFTITKPPDVFVEETRLIDHGLIFGWNLQRQEQLPWQSLLLWNMLQSITFRPAVVPSTVLVVIDENAVTEEQQGEIVTGVANRYYNTS